MCLGKKNSRAFVTFVTTTARLLFEQQERRENDDVVVVARKVFAGEKIVVCGPQGMLEAARSILNNLSYDDDMVVELDAW